MGFAPGDEDEVRNIERKADDSQPFSGLAFKIMNDPYMGTLTFTRIYSGTLSKGDSFMNSTKGKKERVGRMVMMHSNKQDEITEAFAGDIVAIAGLKETTTGDTVCDPNKPVVLETMTFPDPVIEIAVEPKSKADQEKMSVGLQRLAAEDPSFRSRRTTESGQTIMKGMGELHLDILIDRLKREFKVEANIGQPQVAYREKIGRGAEIDYTHKKQSGGTGQFARVKLEFEPLEIRLWLYLRKQDRRWCGSEGIHPGRRKRSGKRQGKRPSGWLSGYGLQGHAGRRCVPRCGLLGSRLRNRVARCVPRTESQGDPRLMEPVMAVEVVTPEDYMGDVIGDLNSRRGQIQGSEPRGNAVAIKAFVPLVNMFGYVSDLRGMSQGRAQFTMLFDHYDEVPRAEAQKIISEVAGS